MPIHKLNAAWTKIASAGANVSIVNTGLVPVSISKGPAGFGKPLPPAGSHHYSNVSADLYARSAEPKAEVLTTITPGMPRDI